MRRKIFDEKATFTTRYQLDFRWPEEIPPPPKSTKGTLSREGILPRTRQTLSFQCPSQLRRTQRELSTDTRQKKRNHTLKSGRLDSYAYQGTDWYYWYGDTAPVVQVSTGPRPYNLQAGAGVKYAPLSIYNNWPNSLENCSLFPLLLPDPDEGFSDDFYAFVHEWYHSACAIVFKSEDDYKIVGTGSLIGDRKVITARHCFEEFPQDKLYVRFFNYKVERAENRSGALLVVEHYLDCPIIKIERAKNGFDAGYLYISTLLQAELFQQYAKIVSPTECRRNGLQASEFIEFHFANGQPHVSVGKNPYFYDEYTRVNRQDSIEIQAGGGASGAGVLCKNFNNVFIEGISIYRLKGEYDMERRVLTFLQMDGVDHENYDEITAPYHFNPNFCVLSVPGDQEGYEYINWDWNRYVKKSSHPNLEQYEVKVNNSNHHIIPRADLLFLWEYFHTIDHTKHQKQKIDSSVERLAKTEEKRLRKEEREKIKKNKKNKERKVKDQKEYQFNSDRLPNKVKKYKKDKRLEIARKPYDKFHQVMLELMPETDRKKSEHELPHWFAWSFWNLFKGWSETHRYDDPRYHHQSDLSEKVKPKSFDSEIWWRLKNRENGLHSAIHELKQHTCKKHQPLKDKKSKRAKIEIRQENNKEAKVYTALRKLSDLWHQKEKEHVIHQTNDLDWELEEVEGVIKFGLIEVTV